MFWGYMFRGYDRLVRGCATAAGLFATALMGVLLVDVLAGVVFRYVLALPLESSEELARFLIIAITFVGAVTPLEQGRHFQLVAAVDLLRPRWRRMALVGANLVVGATLLVLLTHGWAMTVVTTAEVSPAMGLPYAVTYAAIPIGAGLMLLVVVRDLWALLGQPA